MDLTGITKKIKTLTQLVEELLCKLNNTTETDPTVPDYIKNLTETQVTDILYKLETDIGSWI